MKYIIIIGLAAMMFLLAGNAKGDGYAGISGLYVDGPQTNHTAVQALGGYQFNAILAIEGRWSLSSSEEGYRGSDVEIDSMWGAYFVFSLPLFDNWEPYALFGHSRAEFDSDYGDYSKDSQSTSIGFGVKYNLREAWTIRAEYTKLFNDVDAFGIGLNLNF